MAGFLAAVGARPPLVLVVQPDATIQGMPVSSRLAAQAFSHACTALKTAQVPFSETADTKVAKTGLPPGAVAIFPYNPLLSPGEDAKIAAFLSAGGRAIFVHSLPGPAARLWNVSPPQRSQAQWPGQYHKLLFADTGLLGCPAEVTVRAEWVHTIDPPQAIRRLGTFVSSSGRAQAGTGIYMSASLAYVTCLLVASDPAESGALLRALIGHYAPLLWNQLVPPSSAELGPLEGASSLAALLQQLSARQAEGPHVKRALRAGQEAEASLKRARSLLSDGFADAAVALAGGARRAAEQAFWMAWPSRADELRGVWACPVAEPSWEAAAEALAAARFNAVFPYVASAAAAYYPSSVLPPAADYPGRDALTEIIEACHSQGLTVHARLLGLSCLFATDETCDKLASSGRLMVSSNGKTLRWLCPVSADNRRQVIAAAEEIVAKYPVDGLQLDYFRYPGLQGCYCTRCREAFEASFGRRLQRWPQTVLDGAPAEAYDELRRRQLDGLLGEIRTAVRRARPGLPLSAAVFANWEHHRHEIGQDWVRWLQQGLLTFACPMNYTPSPERFSELVTRQRGWVGPGARLCFGIGPYADRMGDFPTIAVARQITLARASGQGWVLFNLRPELLERDLPRLSAGMTWAPARLPPWAGGKG
ncbi:MAG: family 10 glycosylhydrolase [Armatimonadetes bacterium]|nr:family 10 glycosylhydrolase [Armatimonadota bacterium]